MNELSIGTLLLSIFALTLMSAYFSSSETAMMALNRYRLRHLSNEGHRGARKASRLLQRPDQLLGVILIGNNLVNFVAASIATVIGTRLLGENLSVIVTPIVLTIYILIFADVSPKTVAAQRPETIAFPSSYLLQPLLAVARPLVVFINTISNLIANPLIARAATETDELSVDELKTVVNERAAIPRERQDMLLRILDLENVSVDDIMVPRADIAGIDIDDDSAEIIATITSSQHTLLPIYREHVNNVLGILHLRRATRILRPGEFSKADLMRETEEPYFVPEGTPLHTQLFNFQKHKQRIALVVDEYGEVQGLVTLEDLLEEIVGEFTTDYTAQVSEIVAQDDGSFIIEGRTVLRDINRLLDWNLPTSGPRTLNGLILEHLEFIPESNVCMSIDGFRIETLQIADNVVRTLKVTAPPAREDAAPSAAGDAL